MGLLDGLIKQALGGQSGSGGLGSLLETATSNPQVMGALAGLLSTRDTSVGGSGGLAGIVNAFQKKGLGDMVSSWISTGPNPPVTAGQLTDVLGTDVLGQFAAKAGVSHGEAGGLLASLLPTVIDQLTPQGNVPEADSLESTLGGLLSSLGR